VRIEKSPYSRLRKSQNKVRTVFLEVKERLPDKGLSEPGRRNNRKH
jgi:hypothetical protein